MWWNILRYTAYYTLPEFHTKQNNFRENAQLTECDLNELKDEVLDCIRQSRDTFNDHILDISRHSLDYLKPHDKVLIWGYSELIASFVESAVNSKSRKTPITLLISGRSKDALNYQKRLGKHLERKLLQIIIIGDGAFFSVMPIIQKVCRSKTVLVIVAICFTVLATPQMASCIRPNIRLYFSKFLSKCILLKNLFYFFQKCHTKIADE